ncbi:MAG: hypothetical protein KIH09_12120 [Candidatus Freyarchaeota archaeon]|nr:hypothetical protein [Candidatus Jordarchaeia archaeon]
MSKGISGETQNHTQEDNTKPHPRRRPSGFAPNTFYALKTYISYAS